MSLACHGLSKKLDPRIVAITENVKYDFTEIDVDMLCVDRRYQRPIGRNKVKEMADTFVQPAMGVLIVNRRKDGTLVVIDGQHRLEAAKKAKIKSVPCMVYDGLSLQQEAAIFTICNRGRKTPRAMDTFKSRLIYGDSVAEQIRDVVSECGMTIGDSYSAKGVNEIRATSALEKVFEAGGADLLRRTLSIINKCWPPENAVARSGDMIEGLATVLQLYPEIDERVLIRKLSRVKPEQLKTEANALTRTLGVRAGKALIPQIVKAYNKGLTRHKRLTGDRITGRLASV